MSIRLREMKLLITILFTLFPAVVGAQGIEPILIPSADDIIFYESFDKIIGKGGNDETFEPEGVALGSTALFDHSNGAGQKGLLKGYKCIYMGTRNAYSYTTPSLSVVPVGKVLLSFRMVARTYYVANSDYLTIECTGGASLSSSKFTAEK